MNGWIWSARNPLNAGKACKAPLKEQWIFYYSKKSKPKTAQNAPEQQFTEQDNTEPTQEITD
jgi:hypothetical protein